MSRWVTTPAGPVVNLDEFTSIDSRPRRDSDGDWLFDIVGTRAATGGLGGGGGGMFNIGNTPSASGTSSVVLATVYSGDPSDVVEVIENLLGTDLVW